MSALQEQAVQMIADLSDDDVLFLIEVIQRLMHKDVRIKEDQRVSPIDTIQALQELNAARSEIWKYLPPDFDPDRELEEARFERYGSIDGHNAVIDYLMTRAPFFKVASDVMTRCAIKELNGYIAIHSGPTLWCILRKTPETQHCQSIKGQAGFPFSACPWRVLIHKYSEYGLKKAILRHLGDWNLRRREGQSFQDPVFSP